MEKQPKRIVKQILQFDDRNKNNPWNRIGSLYEDSQGRHSGVIDLNVAVESPKGDDRYLTFFLVDPIQANNLRNKGYQKRKEDVQERIE